MQRRSLLIALALAAVGLPSTVPAQAQDWPSRPVKVIVGYPPGGATDVAARLLAAELGKSLGQQVVIENKPGAGGMVAGSYVVRSEPDGYTLLMGASAEVTIAPITVKTMPFDPLKDLAPITLVGQVPFFMVINPALPVSTLAEFIAYAKANPGKLNYSSFGNNTSNHFAGELFKSMAGVNTIHVPYKGSGPSIADLMSGQVQYSFDSPPAVIEQVRGGRLRALAISGPVRLASLPDVPTFAEAGLPGFSGGTWFGLLAPSATPAPLIAKINAAVVHVLHSAEMRSAFADRNILVGGDTPAEFGHFIQAELAKWKALANKVGIVAE